MELFLLLSIGMSIVAFISIALNEAPASSPVSDHNLEPTFPLESHLLASSQINTLQLEDQVQATESTTNLMDSIVLPTEQAMPALVASEY